MEMQFAICNLISHYIVQGQFIMQFNYEISKYVIQGVF